MKISTRGRYALRVMIDLAEHAGGGFIPLKEIARRQNISQKYLESIMPALSREGLVTGLHGKGGGYRLARAPQSCAVGEILRLTEGNLSPVACLEPDAKPCAYAAECRTLSMWVKLDRMINGFFDSISLADLVQSGKGEKNDAAPCAACVHAGTAPAPRGIL